MRIHKKAKKLLVYFFAFLCVLGFVYLMYLFFSSSKMYITRVVVTPPEYQNIVMTQIDPILTSKRFYLIDATHTAFIPKRYIKKELLTYIQEIKSVSVSHDGLQGITIDIELRKPLFRLENDLAVDTDGIVYKEPTDISTYPLLTFKKTLPSKDTLVAIDSFVEKAETLFDQVVRIEVDEHDDVTYFFNKSNAKLMTRLDSDTEAIWSTLVSAVATEPLKSSLVEQNSKLQYIDLRFGNKVFYKFGKSVSIATTTKPYDQGILAEPNR